MLIQPVKPVVVLIKIGAIKHDCQMLSLSQTELELSCNEYLEKETNVLFHSKYFRGNAIIREIKFAQFCFTYTLEIEHIEFQPGLLINTRL